MKKKDFLWNVLAIIMVAAMSVGLSSCSKDDKEDDSVSVAMPQVSMDKSGGTQVVPITSNTKWTATSSVSWLTVSPMQGSGNGSIMLTAQANTTGQSRSTMISITAGSASAMIMVTQDGGTSGGDIAGNYVGTLKPMGYSDQPAPCYITITKLSSTTYRITSIICESFKINITSGVNLVAKTQSDGRIQLTTETSYSVEGSYFQGTLTLSIGIDSDNFFFSGTKD